MAAKRAEQGHSATVAVTHGFFLWCILQLFLIQAFALWQPLPSQTRIVPDDGWVHVFFPSIDELAGRFGFKPLRSMEIQPGDLEVRIWSGFGLTGYGGSIIKRVGNKWSAVSMYDPQQTRKINGRYVEPSLKKRPDTIDWPAIWERLEQAGIAEIRDDSEISHCGVVLDGIAYVVEIAKANYYRTYMVGNPQIQRSEDGDRFLRILSILHEAFGESSTDDLANLPIGENRIVASLSTDTSVSGEALNGSQYSVGDIPPEGSVIRLTSEEGLAQGISLDIPQCHEWGELLRRYKGIPGKVVMALFIEADGTVSGAKALCGPHLLAIESLQAAMKWKFAPFTNSNEIRRAVLSIQYDKKWIQFPWIK